MPRRTSSRRRSRHAPDAESRRRPAMSGTSSPWKRACVPTHVRVDPATRGRDGNERKARHLERDALPAVSCDTPRRRREDGDQTRRRQLRRSVVWSSATNASPRIASSEGYAATVADVASPAQSGSWPARHDRVRSTRIVRIPLHMLQAARQPFHIGPKCQGAPDSPTGIATQCP